MSSAISTAIPEKIEAAEGSASAAGGVSLCDVEMVYAPNVRALAGVNLRVEAGSHLAILGASGSGKTTLLGCLSGRLMPTAGTVRCDGRIATIHQDLRLVKQKSALANVLHGAMGRHPLWKTLITFPGHERQRAIALLERVGLGHRIHARVGRLSGGEQQRVAIARALMQDPAILLADEPVASLDAGNARSIMRLLCDLQRERKLTLICVLHDCALAEAHADRIIGFEAGQIVHDDRAADGAASPGISAAKLGITPMLAAADAVGLRGFQRFDACHACETISHVVNPPAADHAPRRLLPIGYAVAAIALLAIYAASVWSLNISARDTEGFFVNMGRFIGKLIPNAEQLREMSWAALGKSLLDTLQMSLLGTTLAVFISWPLAACAARNVGPSLLRPVCRFFLNIIRSVPSIVWALLFVGAVGLGPFAGVLALVAYSLGYLTKFFYEAFEVSDPGPPDALKEIGAGGLQRFLHAVWPASRASVLSSCLFMLEYNVRAASVLGIVGAGGIGSELKDATDSSNWHVVGAILILLGVVVLVLDAISSRVRAWLMKP